MKASNLAFFEFLGDVDLINTEGKRYNDITVDKIKTTAREPVSYTHLGIQSQRYPGNRRPTFRMEVVLSVNLILLLK